MDKAMMHELVEAGVPGLAHDAGKLIDQAGRAVAVDDETFGRCGDLYGLMKEHVSKLKGARKGLVDRLMEPISWVKAQFDTVIDPLEEAMRGVKSKQDAYAVRMETERKAEAARQRETAERKALDLAADLQSQGRGDVADAVLERAAARPEVDTRQPAVKGAHGATSSVRRRWDFEVLGMRFLSVELLDVVQSNPRAMKAVKAALRKTVMECPEAYVPARGGVRAFEVTGTQVRRRK